MRMPKVSILIPVFNRKDYITECIQSALDQTFTDFEVVVVDNASEDGTWEICQQFAAADQRVRIFRNESNIGPVRNWIRCVQEAKGALSKILFSDDSLEPNCLSEMVPKLEDPDVALVYCAARIGKTREQSVIAYSQVDSSRLSSIQFINLVIAGKAPVSPGCVLIRTCDLIKNLHIQFPTSIPCDFEKNGAGPDVMILLLTAIKYPYVANISSSLVYFRVHGDSFTIKNSQNNITKGYQSAFTYFLKNNGTKSDWLTYVAKKWATLIFRNRIFINPLKYIKNHEGQGTLVELLLFSGFLLKIFFIELTNFFARIKRH